MTLHVEIWKICNVSSSWASLSLLPKPINQPLDCEISLRKFSSINRKLMRFFGWFHSVSDQKFFDPELVNCNALSCYCCDAFTCTNWKSFFNQKRTRELAILMTLSKNRQILKFIILFDNHVNDLYWLDQYQCFRHYGSWMTFDLPLNPAPYPKLASDRSASNYPDVRLRLLLLGTAYRK